MLTLLMSISCTGSCCVELYVDAPGVNSYLVQWFLCTIRHPCCCWLYTGANTDDWLSQLAVSCHSIGWLQLPVRPGFGCLLVEWTSCSNTHCTDHFSPCSLNCISLLPDNWPRFLLSLLHVHRCTSGCAFD